MTHPTIHVRTYIIVCVILILFTFLTVGATFLPLTGSGHLIMGLSIALAKATLVVLFFMHALNSSRVTSIVIVVSSFWLILLLVLVMADYLTRGQIPFMPGH